MIMMIMKRVGRKAMIGRDKASIFHGSMNERMNERIIRQNYRGMVIALLILHSILLVYTSYI